MAEVQKRRGAKPIISNSVSEASRDIILDALDAGYSIDEIAPDMGQKLRGEAKFSQEGMDELVNLSNEGAPIPGQSLMNDPDQAYPWEKPAKFANPREALNVIVTELLEPEAVQNIVSALANGAAVADLSIAVLYSKFSTGDINPDVMLLLVEPVMYIMMAIGEEANIKYNIEGNDLDEFDDEDDLEENEEKLNQFRNAFTDVKQGAMEKNISPQNINNGTVPSDILDKVKEKGPEIQQIRSILSRGEA
jgi:hypothetical protein|tara:strand:- start:1849 stop:2595 length:747 start_codon:yes stop_codon:yes gene_type:complete